MDCSRGWHRRLDEETEGEVRAVKGADMRICMVVVLLALCWTSPLRSQQQPQSPAKATTSCEEQEGALKSMAYIDATEDQIWPAAFPLSRGITVAVELSYEAKAFLHTDGSKYELWLGTGQISGGKVVYFLEDLADSCRLPPDPADAVKLLNIHWEVKELSRSQFEQLHSSFMTALSQYSSLVRERSSYFMATMNFEIPLDASRYTIVYDNSWEHLKIEELDLPINGHTTSMIKWARAFKKTVEETFPSDVTRLEPPTETAQQPPQPVVRVTCPLWTPIITGVPPNSALHKSPITHRASQTGDASINPDDFGESNFYQLAGQTGNQDWIERDDANAKLVQEIEDLRNAHIQITPDWGKATDPQGSTKPSANGEPTVLPANRTMNGDDINYSHNPGQVYEFRYKTERETEASTWRVPVTVTLIPTGNVRCPQ
jgi:hypothetical protein